MNKLDDLIIMSASEPSTNSRGRTENRSITLERRHDCYEVSGTSEGGFEGYQKFPLTEDGLNDAVAEFNNLKESGMTYDGAYRGILNILELRKPKKREVIVLCLSSHW